MGTDLDRIRQINDRLMPLKTALLNHAVYQVIDRQESLRTFMAYHIFAVWDFMSLLKALQRRLTCVEVPWLPADDPMGTRLVNEIVLGEECDDDGRGGYLSHFGLYRRAMIRGGAKTDLIDEFLKQLRQGKSVAGALESALVPGFVGQFVRQTFDIIDGGNQCALAAAFTFGREDLLPAVFQQIVDRLNVEVGGGLEEFRYYLERHIGLDTDEHGPMAHRLLQSLCAADEKNWLIAERAAAASLEARRNLWDGINNAIRSGRCRKPAHGEPG